MVDLIYMNQYGRELGYIDKAEGDFSIGIENSFALKIPIEYEIVQDYYVMIEGTEYGGIVDGLEIDTSQNYITISGRTWHGLLATQLIKPPAGNLYYTVSGDLNTILGQLIARLNLGFCMAASSSLSGITVSNYNFSRAASEMDAYTAIRKLLKSKGCKLHIEYDTSARRAVLSAVPQNDYTSDGLDGDKVNFNIRTTRPVNHLHCLGQGEGLDRVLIDLYANEKGQVSKTQTIFGAQHREEAYENTSSDAEALETDGIKRLRELQANMNTCGLVGADNGSYDIDDIVGGVSDKHNVSVITTVAEKRADVTSRGITYETKTAAEVD